MYNNVSTYRSYPNKSIGRLNTLNFLSKILNLYTLLFYLWIFLKTTELVANRVYPDQTPRSAASDLDLHCLHRLICPNTLSKFGKLAPPYRLIRDVPVCLNKAWLVKVKNRNVQTACTLKLIREFHFIWMSFFLLLQ